MEGYLEKHLAQFLTRLSGLSGAEAEIFYQLVQALAHAQSRGSSCLQLSAGEVELLAGVPIVCVDPGESVEVPLVLWGNRLYLQRYYIYESRLARQLKPYAARCEQLCCDPELLAATFAEELAPGEINYQQQAAEKALASPFAIVSGGPGTGKTTTVVKILALIHASLGRPLDVALAAPTGKAAQRLYQSITAGIAQLPLTLQTEVRQWLPEKATTLHRLLGPRRNSSLFRHNHDNPLGWDIILLDEASMIDLAMMSKLVDALKDGGRLLLLGDKDQLASVESGTVLATLIAGLPQCSTELVKTYRFNEAIKDIAVATNGGDGELAWQLLQEFAPDDWQAYLLKRYCTYMEQVREITPADVAQAFQQLRQFMVLCGTRRGQRAVSGINALVEAAYLERGWKLASRAWYHGRPILIRENDYNLGLYNGDIGICLADASGGLKVWFELGDGKIVGFVPAALSRYQTVYAMTIHKSQGSEFAEVMLVLPESDNRVLCRELLYTGITRAKQRVCLVAEQHIFLTAVSRYTKRQSGLEEMLQGE